MIVAISFVCNVVMLFALLLTNQLLINEALPCSINEIELRGMKVLLRMRLLSVGKERVEP